MRELEAVQLLEQRFVDSWTETEIEFANVAFDQPNNKKWVRFTVLFGDSFNRRNCGGTMQFAQSGSIMAYVHLPQNGDSETFEGVQEGYRLVGLIRQIFTNKDISFIRMNTGFIGQPEYKDGLCRIPVSIPFEYDDK